MVAESKYATEILKEAALARSHEYFMTLLSEAVEGVTPRKLKPGENIFKEGDKAKR